jgi:DNA-binding FadR family transcriptional regulator
MAMDPFKPIQNKRIFELVADEVREAILTGAYRPGDKLPSERELSQEMRVGRTIIREALRILELAGLVRIKQGASGGIFVKAPDEANFAGPFLDLIRLGYITIEGLTEARLCIEQDVIELVMTKAKEEDLRLLDDLITLSQEKIDRGERIREENFKFHIVLAQLSQNPILITIVNSIMPIIAVFVEKVNPAMEHSRRILESHREILEQMKKGNTIVAKEKLNEHIIFFSEEFKKIVPLKGVKFSWTYNSL